MNEPLIAVLLVVCSLACFCLGWIGAIVYRRDIMPDAAMNSFMKAASRREAVPEMFAPGENAEIVELNEKLYLPTFKDKCMGCQYAGRYVLK